MIVQRSSPARISKAYLEGYHHTDMRLTLDSTLSNFCHKVLCFFRMSSESNKSWCEIPLASIHVHDYCERLQAQYKLEGADRMNSFLVAEAKLYKTKAISRHEYLSLRVVAPDGNSFYLAFERGRGKIKEDYDNGRDIYTDSPDELVPPPASAPASLPASTSPSSTYLPFSPSQPDVSALPSEKKQLFINLDVSSSSSVASLDSLFCTRGADDRVSPLNSSGKHNSNDEEFCSLIFTHTHQILQSSSSSFSPSRLPLYKLAVLADAVHGMNSEYQLFTANCFFFAGVIVKILRETYHPEFKMAPTVPDRRVSIWKSRGKQPKAGMWNGVEVWDGANFDTTKLKGVFTTNLDKFEKPVSF